MLNSIKNLLSKHHENPIIKFAVIFISVCASCSLVLNTIEIFDLPFNENTEYYVLGIMFALGYAIQYLLFKVVEKE